MDIKKVPFDYLLASIDFLRFNPRREPTKDDQEAIDKMILEVRRRLYHPDTHIAS